MTVIVWKKIDVLTVKNIFRIASDVKSTCLVALVVNVSLGGRPPPSTW